MLVLSLISEMASYLLKKTIEYDSPQREGKAHIAWNLVFIVGLYLLAASYDDHEVTNYLHARFCATDITSDCVASSSSTMMSSVIGFSSQALL